jgi:hypothetical protein
VSETAEADRAVRPTGGWVMADRSLLPTVLGVPPLAAIGVAALLTAVGVGVDIVRIGSLGTVFTVCFIAGCVLAVAWVRRSGLFGPMVQPPLLVAVAVPVVVLLAGAPAPGAGVAERLLVIGAPLVNAFPVMAWGTGAALLLGIFRLIVQRTPKPKAGNRTPAGKAPAGRARKPRADGGAERSRSTARERTSERRPRGGDAARGEGRTSGSPRRS